MVWQIGGAEFKIPFIFYNNTLPRHWKSERPNGVLNLAWHLYVFVSLYDKPISIYFFSNHHHSWESRLKRVETRSLNLSSGRKTCLS